MFIYGKLVQDFIRQKARYIKPPIIIFLFNFVHAHLKPFAM